MDGKTFRNSWSRIGKRQNAIYKLGIWVRSILFMDTWSSICGKIKSKIIAAEIFPGKPKKIKLIRSDVSVAADETH